MDMLDVLSIQFGINTFEAKYLKDTLNFNNSVDDLAEKLVEKFGKPLDITKEIILEIGQKI